jgi:undecaprenyl-diphosphatase
MDNMNVKQKIGIGLIIILGLVSFFYDKQIALLIKSIQNPYLTSFFEVFDPLWAMLILYALMIVIVYRKAGIKWTLPLIVTLVIALGVNMILKLLVMRDRPFGLIETFPIIHLVDSSFPSNHTAVIFSALPILDKEFRKFKYFWIALAIIIAISRLYLEVHYLSDVIFGGLIGYFIGYFVLLAREKYYLKR